MTSHNTDPLVNDGPKTAVPAREVGVTSALVNARFSLCSNGFSSSARARMGDPGTARTVRGLADYRGVDMAEGTCAVPHCDQRRGYDELCWRHRSYYREHGRLPRKQEPGDLRARLLSKVERDEVTGCWNWTASVAKQTGYGQVMMPDHKPRRAHRVMYEVMVGPIPDGMHIDHLCRNKRCVNPEHLQPVTQTVNTRRGLGMPDDGSRCKKGHDRQVNSAGSCAQCEREKYARYRARKKAR